MTLLQELLNLGLVDIGSDDSRFGKMQAASTALSTQFQKSPELLITATLVSLDEDINEDNQFFELVEKLVIDEWNTLRNTHVNRPRQLLRSIAISALASATSEDPKRSGIVWNTAAARLIHNQTHLGKASVLIEKLLGDAFSTAESEALQRAGMISVATKRSHRKRKASSPPEAPSLGGVIKSDDVLKDVARAAGPQNSQGEALNEPNRYWPSQGQPWSNEFTPLMTAALVKAVNAGTSRLADSISSNLAAMEEHLLNQLGEVEALQSKLAESTASGRMRLDVLWWSQARYSPSQKTGYGQLSSAAAALAAAVDLTTLVPPLAPASVTHVLGETVAAFAPREPASVVEYLAQLREAGPGLGDVLPTGDTNKSRVPLIEVVTEAVHGGDASDEILRSRAGVDPKLLLEPAEFATWLFRELQALRIVEDLL